MCNCTNKVNLNTHWFFQIKIVNVWWVYDSHVFRRKRMSFLKSCLMCLSLIMVLMVLGSFSVLWALPALSDFQFLWLYQFFQLFQLSWISHSFETLGSLSSSNSLMIELEERIEPKASEEWEIWETWKSWKSWEIHRNWRSERAGRARRTGRALSTECLLPAKGCPPPPSAHAHNNS